MAYKDALEKMKAWGGQSFPKKKVETPAPTTQKPYTAPQKTTTTTSTSPARKTGESPFMKALRVANTRVGQFAEGLLDFMPTEARKFQGMIKGISPERIEEYSKPVETNDTIGKGLKLAGQAVQFVAGGEALKAVGAGKAAAKAASPVFNAFKNAYTAAKTLPTGVKAAGAIGAGVTAEETIRGAVTPDAQNRNIPSKAGASFRAGIGDMLTNAGAVAKWQEWDDLGNKLASKGQAIQEGYEVQPSQFNWRSFFDPDFYAVNVSRTLPLTLSLIPAMYAGFKIGGAGAAKMGLGPFGKAVVSSLTGAAMSRPLESAMEAGSAYEDAVARGLDPDKAEEAADNVFKNNLKLYGLDAAELAMAFAPAPAKVAGVVAKAGKVGQLASGTVRLTADTAMEAGEEGVQEVFQRQAAGQPIEFDQKMKESMAIGGLMGAGMGGTGAVMDFVRERTIKNLPPEIQEQVTTAIQEKVNEGKSAPEAMEQVLDEIASSQEGEKAVQEAVQQAIDDINTEAGISMEGVLTGEIENVNPEEVLGTTPIQDQGEITVEPITAPQETVTEGTVTEGTVTEGTVTEEPTLQTETEPLQTEALTASAETVSTPKDYSSSVRQAYDTVKKNLMEKLQTTAEPEEILAKDVADEWGKQQGLKPAKARKLFKAVVSDIMTRGGSDFIFGNVRDVKNSLGRIKVGDSDFQLGTIRVRPQEEAAKETAEIEKEEAAPPEIAAPEAAKEEAVPETFQENVQAQQVQSAPETESAAAQQPEETPAPEKPKSTLSDYGLSLQRKTTKAGNVAWEVQGDSYQYKNTLKTLGARWYKPHPKAKGVWTFYGEDPTNRILAKLPEIKKEEKPEKIEKLPLKKEATEPEQEPKFKAGDRVTWQSGGKTLTGTVERTPYQDDTYVSVNCDQIAYAGGVPIGRIELVFFSNKTLKKIEPEAKGEEKPQEISNQPTTPTTQTEETGVKSNQENVTDFVRASNEIADYVLYLLKIGRTKAFTNKKLFEAADKAFGGTQAKGKYTPKDAYDAMELGVNKFILDSFKEQELPGDIDKAKSQLDKLLKMMDVLPTQTKRTEEQDQFQQFSTPPPIAYVAAWAANMNENDDVLEPSAGIGGLAVFAKIAGVKKVIVNELSKRRAALLKELNFDRLFTENAEQLNNILPKDVAPTVVIMNPPFSAAAGRMQGVKKTEFAEAHIEQALKRLAPDGRLVAIVGRGMAEERPTFREWWGKIKKEYNVRANIGIEGKNYSKYGTSFDIQLLVIDKNGPTTTQTVTGNVSKLEDALPLLEAIRNERPGTSKANGTPEQNAGKPTGEKISQTGEAGPGSVDAVPIPTSLVGTGEQQDTGERPGEETDQLGNKNDIGEPSNASKPPEGSGPVTETGAGQRKNVAGPAGAVGEEESGGRSGIPAPTSNVGAAGEGTLGSTIKVEATETNQTEEELTDAVYAPYTPQRLKIPGAKEHPGKLAQSAAMAAVDPPVPTYKPSLPQEIIKEGKLSLAQLETVVYAGQAHQEILSDNTRKGFFIGDGTGVGKGREISGIIMDNFRQGRKKAVWISKNDLLIEDAIRDFSGIGGDPGLIFDLGKIKNSAEVKQNEGIMFVTYGRLSQDLDIAGQSGVIAKAGKKARLDQIINWLGEDFDGVIAFDEAHLMQNSISQKKRMGKTKPALRALAGIELQNKLPNARIVYVSATGATEVHNLAYAERLGLWGTGTAFANKNDFISKIYSGGLAAMELVARDMKAMGSYIARTLSFDGVTYGTIEHGLTPEQVEMYDTMAKGWQIILQNMNQALEETGQNSNGQAKMRARSQFWSAQQRFFNQILASMQMPSAIDQIKKDLEKGESVVLQLVNTFEAAQNRAIAAMEEGDTYEELDITPRGALIHYLEKSFPVQEYETYIDDNGNERSRPVLDSQGNPVQNAEAVEMRDSLIERIGSMKVPEGPIDIILNAFGPENVTEVTGRTRRIVSVLDEDTGQRTKKLERRTEKIVSEDTAVFMNDKKRILIFSDAGGTGRSYHADLKTKNQRKRNHYVIQAGWRADNAVQGMGRTNRTNQASTPHYILVTTNLKGQKRFISSIARRLDQLGALTKGQRQTGSQGLFSEKDNLEGTLAYDALERFFIDLVHGHVKGFRNYQLLLAKMGLDGILDENGNLKDTDDIRDIPKFLNRILVLESEEQNRVFDEFITRLESAVEIAIANGTLDTGLENFKADKVKMISEQTVYVEDKSGAETKYVELEAQNRLIPTEISEFKGMRGMVGFFQNERSEKVYAVRQWGTRTLEDGRVIDLYKVFGQTDDRVTEKAKFEAGHWRKLEYNEATQLWNEAVSKLPEYKTNKVHMITGTILPIWDRLPTGQVRVMRVRTDDGRVYLGRIIPENVLDITLGRLGANRKQQNLTPQEAVKKVLEEGYSLNLANGWRIIRRRVSDEYRIEIAGEDLWRYAENLKREGVFTEKINYATRYFIPTGNDAARILGNIVADRPIVEVVTAKGSIGTSVSFTGNDLREQADKILSSNPPGQELSDVQEELEGEIDEKTGEVKPPIGLSVKVVHAPQKTSIKQVAAGLRIAMEQGIFKKGMTVVDVGGGLWEEGTDYLKSKGITNLVYDPYARKKEHNTDVLNKIKASDGADAAALNNVLNVIPAANERATVIKFLYSLLKPEGKAIITVYEGNKSGKGTRRLFKNNTSTWQENRTLSSYEDEIRSAIPGAEVRKVKGSFVITKKENTPLDNIEKELNEAVDEQVGEVKPPMGFSLRIIRRNQHGEPEEESGYKFDNEDIWDRFQAAQGIDRESFINKIKTLYITLRNQLTREYEHLPRNAEFSPLRTILLRLAKQKGVRGDQTLRYMQGLTIGLNNEQYNKYRIHVILADLMEELHAGHDLPFGFEEESLSHEWERIDREVNGDPDILKALDRRKRLWQAINAEYISWMDKAGVHVAGRFTREDYFRHQVLEYAKKKAPTGTGQRLKTPANRGFLKKREGSAMDINTDYLQAEYEVMAQMLYDIEVNKAIIDIKDRYNIRKRLEDAARAINDRTLNGMIAWEEKENGKGKSQIEKALNVFKQRMGYAFSGLRELAQDDKLWTGDNNEFVDAVNNIVTGTHSGKTFEYLAALFNKGEEGAGFAGLILKTVQERKAFIKDTLGKRYRTWENIIPEGYTTWQPREGNLFYFALSIPAREIEQGLIDDSGKIGISSSKIKKILAMGGHREEFVVKEEVAATLNNLLKVAEENPLLKPLAQGQTFWKVWQLLSPRRWFKYNVRNLSGDAEAVFVGNPQAFTKVPQAITELYPVFAADKPMTQDMKDWFERGGMQSTLQATDIGDIQKLKMFEKLMEKKGTVKEAPLKAWQWYWRTARLSTDFREAVLRYASYLSYLEQMKNNNGTPKNFGASIREEVMALPDIKDRAFKLSNELLGAYDEVSVVGQQLRKYLIPFWSWNEVNFRRTKQLLFNSFRDAGLAKTAARRLIPMVAIRSPFIAYNVGKFALKAAFLWMILQAYNDLFFKDEEKDLPEKVKAGPHIIFGRDKDGKVLYLDRLGFVQDFLGWFGVESCPPYYLQQWLNGKMTIKEVAEEMAKGPWNKIVQGIGPIVKNPVELIMMKSTYPNVYKLKGIRDPWEYIFKSFALENEYKYLAGKPMPTHGGSREEAYWKSFRGSLALEADPMESAYYDTIDEKKRFMKKIGKASYEGSFVSQKSNALCYFKQAIRYRDRQAAIKYLNEYAMMGGTKTGLERSLKTLHPLYGLNKEEQVVFIKTLDRKEAEKTINALVYYETVLNPTQNLAQ